MEYNKDITNDEIIDHYLQKAEYAMKQTSFKVEKQCVEKVREYFELKGLAFYRLLTPRVLQDFIVWRRETITPRGGNPSDVTINKNIAAIKRAFALAKKNDMIPENPFEDVDGIRVDKEDSPRILRKSDIKIIEKLAQGSVIEKELRFLLRTGMRLSEMIYLEVKDIDLNRNIIIVRSYKAKSRKTRYVPIVRDLQSMLHELVLEANKNKRDLVFVNSKGNKHCLRNILRRFKTVLRRAEKQGVNTKGVSIHTLRKSYISYMIMSGQDPVKVMKIVGHQSWQTMRKYLFLTEEYLKDVPEIF